MAPLAPFAVARGGLKPRSAPGGAPVARLDSVRQPQENEFRALVVSRIIGYPMNVADFDFHLPDELIAQEPAERGASRLLVLDRTSGARHHHRISDLPAILSPGDLLVVNDTRVFAARLLGRRVPSGGAVECLILGPSSKTSEPVPTVPPGGFPDRQREGVFEALVHPGQKLKPGAQMRFEGAAGVLMAEVLERKFHGRRVIRLWSDSGAPIDDLIDGLGHIPLPPYIKRADTALDRERYQTVFARVRGSVAAPTAGLHFTRDLLDALESRGIERTSITLHVGYGTFKPVRTDIVEEHVVDPERYTIPESAATAISRARSERHRVISVGTTTTRALEDGARRGAISVCPGDGMATLFIYPGFRFQIVDALLTNFHLPRSSLLMLVAAFGGRSQVLDAYAEAVRLRYRFYSYGDAMLIV